MRRSLSSLLALLCFIAVAITFGQTAHSQTTPNPFIRSAAASTGVPLRVVSWNIAFGQGTDGVTNYDRTATRLAQMQPDIIALCEMPPDNITTLVGLLNQKTGLTWYSHFVPKAPGISEGNLILSKFPFVSTDSHYLSFTRSVAQATINVGGRNINFFATHLDHTSSSLRLTEAMEAVIATGGKQYRVAEGQVISVEKLPGDKGAEIAFASVLLVNKDGEIISAPDRLKSAKVSGTVVSQGRGKKVMVVKFKRRKNYRRHRGHRQSATTVRITTIEV